MLRKTLRDQIGRAAGAVDPLMVSWTVRMNLPQRWRSEARRIGRETYALYLACRDPRLPWYAKVFAAGVVAHAFNPIDLIPDFVPALGYIDDLVLMPLGVLAVRTLVPEHVMPECRTRAATAFRDGSQPAWPGNC